MSKSLMRILCSLIAFISINVANSLERAGTECNETEIQMPIFSGGVYGGGSWLLLRPAPTDGDLQYGTHLRLTGQPANLNAFVLELKPDYHSCFRLNFGYQIPQTGYNIHTSYFFFSDDKSEQVNNLPFDEFIQNFLGGSFSTASGSEKQKIHQADLLFGKRFVIDQHLGLHPYTGLHFADVKRTLDVMYTDLVLNPFPSSLGGDGKSHYWGVGPIGGVSFKCPVSYLISIAGHFGAGALLGKQDSSIQSDSIRGNLAQSFNDHSSRFRVVPILNSDVALVFTYPFERHHFALEIAAGFEVDYFFRVINRINPFNGYINNLSTTPVKQASNLGFGGPYAKVSLIQIPEKSDPRAAVHFMSDAIDSLSGLYGDFTSAWLKPSPNNDDLTYAILHTTGAAHAGCIDQFRLDGNLYSWL